MQHRHGKDRWHQNRSKKRSYWGILNLVDLSNTNRKNSQLVSQLQARYPSTAKAVGDEKPAQKEEDFSI